jgi:hypothetical protein
MIHPQLFTGAFPTAEVIWEDEGYNVSFLPPTTAQ